MHVKSFILLAAAVLTLSACSESPPPPAANQPSFDPSTQGTLIGTVVVDGTLPPANVIRLDGDPKCEALADGEIRRLEDVVVGEGNGLQHVFVHIKEGLPPALHPVPAEAAVLDQQKCRYLPRVLGLQVGQPLLIRNSDPLLHNVRAEAQINQSFDVGTPVQGVEVTRTFATSEVVIPIKCNVHAWMKAYVGVLEHPFFVVSDHRGQFSIARVPAGTYTVEIWHEHFGTQTQQVSLAAGQTANLSFAFKAS